MARKVIRVRHRHSDQKGSHPDLILEVGKGLPNFYQAGRPRGTTVVKIEGSETIACHLSAGDVIMIGPRSVVSVDYDE